jgi:hypothetical protein
MDPRFSTMTALNEAIRSTGVEMDEDVSGTVMITISREKLLTPSASTLLGKLSEP